MSPSESPAVPPFPPTDLLRALGWKSDHCPVDSFSLARVVRHDRAGWTLASDAGDLLAELRGKLRHSMTLLDRPCVGDWVTMTPRISEQRATIESVIARTSSLVRTSAGETSEPQVVAANVDVVLITVPSDASPNPRRVERELITVWESGAQPVIVMTKADLGTDHQWVDAVALGAPIVPVSALDNDSLSALTTWLTPATTIVLLGPSGAGKSTLANGLLQEDRLDTGEVRVNDHRGRHTTTRRELLRLPSGALLIDTPGIRELALWDAEEGVDMVFADIDELAAACRFSDCSHRNEPGCAIIAAVAEGGIDEGRLRSWHKLQREAAFQARRVDHRLAAEERRKWAQLTKASRGRTRP